jgi:hypothetical protein
MADQSNGKPVDRSRKNPGEDPLNRKNPFAEGEELPICELEIHYYITRLAP